MAQTGNAARSRGLALAVTFLLLAVESGEVGHAFASRKAHGPEHVLLATDTPLPVSDSTPPHSAPDCPLCQAARVSSVVLNAGAACTLAVPETTRAVTLPEQVAPTAPRRLTETARAPPARLAI